MEGLAFLIERIMREDGDQEKKWIKRIKDPNDFIHRDNSSEPLGSNSLHVPRNDKLVKIDGNLIIHSVMAGEGAISCICP